ncbi:MAG: hypothetical protein F2799_07125 [Actinobacteria bacterium]|uniref:Unannotated protein n=1 Tax=freshwater metagenome TaxID=449393 RepID=A0A6J7EI23_9ZZZZ|nr:hypothetical protein [Actinomycetota bacterium]
MTIVDDRFEQYSGAARAGEGIELAPLLDGLGQVERAELTARARRFDAWHEEASGYQNALKTSPELERLGRSAAGVSGVWPSLLPQLRREAGVDREQLTQRLHAELDPAEDANKVGQYYHQMEWGTLPASGVSRVVIEALANILDTDPDELQGAGTAGAAEWERKLRKAQAGRLPKRVFARLVGESKPLSINDEEFSPPKAADWDETDRLFLGG